MAVAVVLVALIALIVFAGFLAASETALMRVSRIRVRYLVEKKVNKAEKLEKLIEDPAWFLPTLLLVLLVVQLTSASLATWLVTKITGNAGVGVVVGTAIVTAFLFLFGELIPKASASHDSEKVAMKVTTLVTILSKLLRPIALLFEWLAGVFLRLFGKRGLTVEKMVSDEGEIIAMVSVAEEHDVIEEEEKEMIHSVFEFGDTLVREVMVPRPDMATLPIEATVKEALALTTDRGFSRIPVYKDDLDNIVGVLYAKDLLRNLQEGRLDRRVRELVREAYVIPETKRLSDLLKEFQKRKVHISIVVDEYGIVVGLVTIEDLLEEIVGEIFDEFDREVVLFEKIAPMRYRVDARENMDDLNELLGIELPHEGADTVGGLVFKVLGNVPGPGESFVYNGVVFRVEAVKSNRISKVVLELTGREQEQPKW